MFMVGPWTNVRCCTEQQRQEESVSAIRFRDEGERELITLRQMLLTQPAYMLLIMNQRRGDISRLPYEERQ